MGQEQGEEGGNQAPRAGYIRALVAAAWLAGAWTQAEPGNPTVLQPLYRVLRNTGYVSVSRTGAPGVSEGLIAFTIKSPVPGTVALRCYRHSGTGAARDSIEPEKAPWVAQGEMGRLFTAQEPGAMALVRYHSGQRWYTARENEPAKPGYARECLLGYAYRKS